MKPIKLTSITMGLCLIVATTARGQFSSGSDGSYGPLNPTISTNLDMPANGIFNLTTINIPNGVTVRFNRNALNTPVYLLAQSNVVISGTIDVSGGFSSGSSPGRAGPGGFDGGVGSFQNSPAAAG